MKLNAQVPVLPLALLGLTLLGQLSPAFAADNQSAKDAYLKFHAEIMKANKIDDVQQYLCKKANEEINSTPADMKPMMFGFMKATMPDPVKVVTEEVTGNSAKLTLTTSKNQTEKGQTTKEEDKGSVTLVKEDGAWKIDKEKWESKVEVTGADPSPTPQKTK